MREQYAKMVNSRLRELAADAATYPRLREAMSYSLLAGGKRIRPVLHLMANAVFGGEPEDCLDLACAIEMVHTYSLIHDDLPAMDNDSLRRGRPTNHVIFGDAVAILAGDALLSYAFETMLRTAASKGTDRYLRAVRLIAEGCGVSGMLAGQAADVCLEGTKLTSEQIDYIHARKTGALITASVASGAAAAGAAEDSIRAMRLFGDEIGLAFQIVDDVLDVTGTAEVLGKNPGKDQGAGKCTFVTLYGVDGARQMARECTQRAADRVRTFGSAAEPLAQLAEDILRRDS